MPDLPNRKRNRLRDYDYSRDNLYFVTNCVQNKVCCLGHVQGGEMVLNEYGRIADQQWHWLADQYPYVELHAFVVMPNHVHGIIEINRNKINHDPTVKIKSLSQLMGAYQTTASKHIHLAGLLDFKWQRSFHDRIIRNDEAYQRISRYIENNPRKWGEDKFYQ